MKNEINTQYNKDENLHEALLSPPHDEHKFRITIENLGIIEDVDSLKVEVRKADSDEVLIAFQFIERLDNVQNKKVSSFTIPIGIDNATPPYEITISSDNGIDMETYVFNIEWISIKA